MIKQTLLFSFLLFQFHVFAQSDIEGSFYSGFQYNNSPINFNSGGDLYNKINNIDKFKHFPVVGGLLIIRAASAQNSFATMNFCIGYERNIPSSSKIVLYDKNNYAYDSAQYNVKYNVNRINFGIRGNYETNNEFLNIFYDIGISANISRYIFNTQDSLGSIYLKNNLPPYTQLKENNKNLAISKLHSEFFFDLGIRYEFENFWIFGSMGYYHVSNLDLRKSNVNGAGLRIGIIKPFKT